MYFDQADTGVYWNALDGGTTYCIGLAASNGQDTSGTFLRSASDTPPTIYPTFTATLDRAS
jgi:subtilase family serine protease